MILIKFIDNCIEGYGNRGPQKRQPKKARGKARALLPLIIYWILCIDFAEKSVFQDFHDFFQGRTEMDGGKVFLFDESKA